MTQTILALVFTLGICIACYKQTMDFSVTSMAVLPTSKTVIFMFGAPTVHEALVVKGVQEDIVLDLSSYLSLHGKAIIRATTYVELRDVKFLLSPQHNGRTYHVSIMLDRPLAPGEFDRGFSLDGGYDSISFLGNREAEDICSQNTVVLLDAVPHKLHFMLLPSGCLLSNSV